MIPRKKRQKYKKGDVFVVPLCDGTYSLGQVLSPEPKALNSVACAYYSLRIVDGPILDIPTPLPLDNLISVTLTTPDLLNRATWPVVADRTVNVPSKKRPYERYRSKEWVGAKIIGSGIIRQFLNAYFGLAPWDAMDDPNYYESLLLDPSLKPSGLIYERAA